MQKIYKGAEKAKKLIKKALSKVWGVFDAIGKIIILDKSAPPAKVPFLKLHEAGHAVFPWQKDIYAFEDCEKTLSPEISELFEREANVFASEVLFQLDTFQNEAAQHSFGIRTPLDLGKKYGASTYSTIRRYVSTHQYACAVMVLNMPQMCQINGFVASLRRPPDASPSFKKIMGEVQWPTQVIPTDKFGLSVPVEKKRMTGKRLISMTNANGETVECLIEGYTNTYQVFLLVMVKDTIKKKTVIIPTLKESIVFSNTR